jgi:hypothetical protein
VHKGVVEPQLLFISDEALSQQTHQHAKMCQYGVKKILMLYGMSLNSVKVMMMSDVSMQETICSIISERVMKLNLHGARHASRLERSILAVLIKYGNFMSLFYSTVFFGR